MRQSVAGVLEAGERGPVLGDVLDKIGSVLADKGVRYALLHGWQNKSDSIKSDIDLVVAAEDLNRFQDAIENTDGWRIVQVLKHQSTCFYFVVSIQEQTMVQLIAIDVCTDYRRDGLMFFTGGELLRGRKLHGQFWVAGAEAEFKYLVVKKILKGALSQSQAQRLTALHNELGLKATWWVERSVGRSLSGLFWTWIEASDRQEFQSARKFKRALCLRLMLRDPLNPVRYWALEVTRVWTRLTRPAGLFVAIMGCDGVGKSTLINELATMLSSGFRDCKKFHFRPHVFERASDRSYGPPDRLARPHNRFKSSAKIAYYIVDYVCGYWTKMYPLLVRGRLVLGDRYYHDLFVDAQRYRYGGPQWLLKLAASLIPGPDLFIFAGAAPEAILSRKTEASLDELKRYSSQYQNLCLALDHAVQIDATSMAAEVSLKAASLTLDVLHERYRRRYRPPERMDREQRRASVQNSVRATGVVSGQLCVQLSAHRLALLSLKNGRSYLVPKRPNRAAVEALRMYNPQSGVAATAAAGLRFALRLGLAQPFLPKVHAEVNTYAETKAARAASVDLDTIPTDIFDASRLRQVLGESKFVLSASIGTPGPHQKPVIQVMNGKGRVLGYAKVGVSQATNQLVANESWALGRLAGIGWNCIEIPKTLEQGWLQDCFCCVMSSRSGLRSWPRRSLSLLDLEALMALRSTGTTWLSLEASPTWFKLQQSIPRIPQPYYRELVYAGMERLAKRLGRSVLPFYFCHGDYAPWNSKRDGHTLYLFDWEYAREVGEPGFDLLYFLSHAAWLLNDMNAAEMWRLFFGNVTQEPWNSLGLGEVPFEDMLLLYLIDHISFRSITRSGDPITKWWAPRLLSVLVNR